MRTLREDILFYPHRAHTAEPKENLIQSLHAGKFFVNFCHLLFFSKLFFSKKNSIRVSNSLVQTFDQTQHVKNFGVCLVFFENSFVQYTIDTESHNTQEKLKVKIVDIFLPISFNICFGCSKEPSHGDGSFEYPQHMFWLRNKKNSFLLRTK